MWKAEPGTRIGAFELVEKLGRGAFAEVWSARPAGGGDIVALKILLSDDEKAFRQALREARICAQIDHPHVVSVSEVFVEDGLLVQVMEYLRGGNLRQLMLHADHANRWVPRNVAREVAAALAMALDHITNGVGSDRSEPWSVVHRDIKPSNVLLGGTGQVKLADFGIFRAPEHLTATVGPQACTPRYAAPEVLLESPATPESDLFSLGCVLFEMVVRQQAFPGDQLSMMRFKVEEFEAEMHRPTLERLAPELCEVILALLDPRPERRPTAEQVRQALIGDRRVYDPVPLIRYMQRVRPVGQATTRELPAGGLPIEPASAPPPPPTPSRAPRSTTQRRAARLDWSNVGLGVTFGLLLLAFGAVLAFGLWGTPPPEGADAAELAPVERSESPEPGTHQATEDPEPELVIEPLPPARRGVARPRQEPVRRPPVEEVRAAPAPDDDQAPEGEASPGAEAVATTEEPTAAGADDGLLSELESAETEPSLEEASTEPEDAPPEPEEAAEPARACLLVSSQPAGATVSFGGRTTGRRTAAAPTPFALEPGAVSLTLRSDDGAIARWRTSLDAGQTQHVVCDFSSGDAESRCYRGVVRGGAGCP